MKRKTTRIAVLDNHLAAIEQLKTQLQHHFQLQVQVTAMEPGDLLCQLTRTPVDIVLADETLLFEHEDELTKKFKELFPQMKLVAWLAAGQNERIDRMIDEQIIAGAIPKEYATSSLIDMLEKLRSNTSFRDVVLPKVHKMRLPKTESDDIHLTDRELEVIRLIEQEYSNKQIAQTLFISERTVETHRKNIFRKTKTNTVIGLIKYAYSHKLV